MSRRPLGFLALGLILALCSPAAGQETGPATPDRESPPPSPDLRPADPGPRTSDLDSRPSPPPAPPVIYPAGLTRSVQIVLGALVVGVNIAIYLAVLRRRRRRDSGAA